MNAPEGESHFVPKQAIAPTPQLYDELVSDSMENLARASLTVAGPIKDGEVIHDNGCGTGAGTTAVVESIPSGMSITIKGKNRAVEHTWPAEGVHDDSNALQHFGDGTFDLAIGNALLFVLPDDGAGAVREVHRTLKPGGSAAFNSWKYVPNMPALSAAAKSTRPEGTPLPRAGLDKWASAEFLQGVVEKGGFEREDIAVHEALVSVTTSEVDRYAHMLWSFIGGTTAVGWLESDEVNWDRAIQVIKDELKKTEGYREIEDGRLQLQFVANIVVAKK